MNNENPSIISHVSIGTNQFDKARAFYDAVLPRWISSPSWNIPAQLLVAFNIRNFGSVFHITGKPPAPTMAFIWDLSPETKNRCINFMTRQLRLARAAMVHQARAQCMANLIKDVLLATLTVTKSKHLVGMPNGMYSCTGNALLPGFSLECVVFFR